MNEVCSVCLAPTTLYNYGVLSCNACKMFFRRVLRGRSELVKCTKGKECFRSTPFNMRCRQCRYLRCVEVGMTPPVELKELLPEILTDALHRNNDWMEVYTTRFPPNINPSVDEILDRHVELNFQKKPLNFQMSPQNWAFLCELSCINFLKGFEIMHKLEPNDAKTLLKGSMFKCCMFRHCVNAAIHKSNFLTFPDGSKLGPDCLRDAFDSKFRNRLVARLMELKINDNEAVLLGMVLFCNPAIQRLSDSGREITSKYSKTYSSALFRYCQINYQDSAPSRFTDILSLFHIVTEMFEDMSTFFEILRVWQKHTFNQVTLDCMLK